MSRDRLLEKGWRRHSVVSLSPESISALAPELPDRIMEMVSADGAIVLIALYDCGVVHDSFDQEPWVQLLIAVPTNFEKRFSKGRDARRLHFTSLRGDKELAFEVNANGVCQIDRRLLLRLEADSSYNFEDAVKFDLKQWLAERYRQDTWPDAFNNAIRSRVKKLKKFYERYNDFVSGLYIKLNPNEELTEGKYTVALIIAVEAGKERLLLQHLRKKYKSLENKEIDEIKAFIANEVLNALGDSVNVQEDRTNKTHGAAIEVLEENQITMHHQRTFGRLSPYALSEYGTDPPIPVDIIPTKVH